MAKTTHSLPLNIFLLGDPAAGKATHGERLVKLYPLIDCDMGKELRKRQSRDLEFRKLLAKTYDKGKTTQTDVVRKIFKQIIAKAPKNKGILFNGNPKMIGEAKLIKKWLDERGRTNSIVVYLSIPMRETVKRMRNRQQYFKGKFSKRTDDTDQALRNRVKYYHKNIAQVLKFLKKFYPYKKISTMGSIPASFKRVDSFIENFYEKRSN